MREDRPSNTAVKVALAVPFVGHDRRCGQLMPPELVEASLALLEASGAVRPWQLRLMERPWYRRFGSLMERLMLRGQILHLALRKRFVGDEVEAALADGATQVLVVGAGLDSLCWRLAKRYPDVRWVEIDHPASQASKRKALGRLDRRPNLQLVPADFTETDLLTAVRGIEDWDLDAHSVVVAEGLLMYLSDDDVASFLGAAARVGGTGTRLVFSYLERTRGGRFLLGRNTPLFTLVLRLQGEPFRWGVRRQELPTLLADHGWTLLPEERFDLRRRYLEPERLGDEPLSTAERLAVAEVA